jgi:serine/threonine-protein kinase
MDARDLQLPSRIGRYRIERLLGRGAMGRVLLGRDGVLDRDVAVKLLRDDLAVDFDQRRALVDRMRHEAKACARVAHPNIVALFDMGEDDELGLYLVFEYAEGTTLKERLARAPLPAALAARVAREVGGALSTAHESGVLHRDVKPENIILTVHGSKVADFGIARVPNSTLTRDGGLLGTPAYSAPECITNGEFSPQSDQFSLAATLYEALSQRRAFPGDDAVTVANHIQTDEPPAIANGCGLDPHVDGVLARALSKEPERRFPSAREFGDALAEALERGTRGAMPTIPDTQHRLALGERSNGGARSASVGPRSARCSASPRCSSRAGSGSANARRHSSRKRTPPSRSPRRSPGCRRRHASERTPRRPSRCDARRAPDRARALPRPSRAGGRGGRGWHAGASCRE